MVAPGQSVVITVELASCPELVLGFAERTFEGLWFDHESAFASGAGCPPGVTGRMRLGELAGAWEP